VVLQGAELYQEEAKNEETLTRYGRGTPNDWIERNIYSKPKWRSLGIVLMLVADILMFGIPGVAIWAIQMMWIPFFAAGVVNGVGHFWGYRNFECPDAARNISPIGLIMGGEELHNNHHTFAASAKLSVRWWEFDIGWFYICILKAFHLAKVYRSVPKLNEDRTKKVVDIDSLKAIVSNRFHVMDDYWKEVIVPVIKNEKLFFKRYEKHARTSGRLLIREESIIKQDDQNFLQTMLKGNTVFETVYSFRLKLQEIWHMTNQNQQELLDLLNKWCKQAEATGIAALQDFAKKLQYYSVHPA
jgi:stearoyl-CoA desaturase (delta-9 desaturase)